MSVILLIDDDRDDADLFREALEEVGPGVDFHYFDGSDGVKKLMEGEIPIPDLIFLDLNMPSFSGWHCLENFKADHRIKPVPIIIYSTSSLSREKLRAKQLGAAAFITKPNDFRVLKDFISIALHTEASQLETVLDTMAQR